VNRPVLSSQPDVDWSRMSIGPDPRAAVGAVRSIDNNTLIEPMRTKTHSTGGSTLTRPLAR